MNSRRQTRTSGQALIALVQYVVARTDRLLYTCTFTGRNPFLWRYSARGLLLIFAVTQALAQPILSESPVDESREAYFSGNLDAAREGLAPLATSGHPEAAYYLGLIERDEVPAGSGSVARALALWEVAAARGHALAMWELGNAYDNGFGVSADVLLAMHWYRLGEKAEMASRSTNDVLYLNSHGQPMTQFESMAAIDKNEELAMAGDSEIAYSLARLYDLGEGVERDDANAILWYTVAAENGHDQAALVLAYLACWGEGVARNVDVSNVWLGKSGRAGKCTDQHTRD